jgi:hypothetical protein
MSIKVTRNVCLDSYFLRVCIGAVNIDHDDHQCISKTTDQTIFCIRLSCIVWHHMIGVRASTISPSQLAIRIKVIFFCLVGGERRGERREVGSHARASSSTCS